MTKTSLVRWGILSTAEIARKNWLAIKNSGNGIVTAVASREESRSAQFIDDCQHYAPFIEQPAALGSYDELLMSPDVDAVYVPLPTGLRKEWVIRAAMAGKHVVCEKPCAINHEDLAEMTKACRENKVQFMDGVMFMHSARLAKIRELLDDGKSVGALRRLTAQFSFNAPEEFFTGNIRSHSNMEPHGCLGDLGWYCIRFFLWAMNWQMPEKVVGRLIAAHQREGSPEPVPTQFSAEMFFKNGPTASFYVSFVTENQQWLHVSGSNGYLRVDDFVLPWFGGQLGVEVNNADFDVQGSDFNMVPHFTRHMVNEYSNSFPNAQETHLFRSFADQVLSGKLNTEWPEWALNTQKVLEACYESALNDKPIKF